MKLLAATLVGVMTLAGAGSVSAANLESEVKSAAGYVAPVEKTDLVTINDWIYTAGYIKNYKNLYNITVATQDTTVQWRSNDAKTQNLAKVALWQDNWTAIGYGFTNESDTWNYFYTDVGQAKQSVKFESGIPTPWGHVGGTTFTSTIVTSVYPNGNTSAY